MVQTALATAPVASERERLAELALAAALATPGVLGVAGDYATATGMGRLAGVVAAAGSDGRYDLDLFLRADLVALHPLAELVRRRVHSAAERGGDGALVGALGVSFLEIGAAAPEAR